ncbi:pilus assembly protein [Massilia sp. 9096]|uniref:pilus assembly protein n=1 Tax=Massilia sp. 9096 TaxID=1500894 RepID=UPI00056A98BF|nr:PilC/PilY family type IV pilus protein [Massilia sp. 9096]
MKKILGFLVLLMLACTASAGVTGIAQVPLLNITGTGNVRPNMMLLYDNSGSMAWSYTPDYVGGGQTTCRSGASLADGQRVCYAGEPPFNSPDFNKQYYNPAIRYTPPVYADGTSYPSQNRANTTTWSKVAVDGFGINMTDMLGNQANGSTINLVSGFPDWLWCSDNKGTNCTARNKATYAYPDATFKIYYDTSTNPATLKSPVAIGSNPYYFRINVGEYCVDKSLTSCKTTAVNAPAPAGYPEPAKVRWCDTAKLDGKCQAKYVDGQYIYPRFSNAGQSALQAYGTLTVGASSSSNSLSVASVSVSDSSGNATVITSAAAVASSGTTSAALQQTEATDLAYRIIAKSGLTNQYTACVNAPSGSNASYVPACLATYGFTLSANNVVAVIPLACAAGTTAKTQCKMLQDGSQSGWALSADTPGIVISPVQPATALVGVTGSTYNTNTLMSLSSLKLGSVETLPSTVTFAKSNSSAQVAQAIVNAIGTGGDIKAYIGGSSVTNACKNVTSPTTTVCLLNYANVSAGQSVLIGKLANATSGSIVLKGTSSVAGALAKSDSIPVQTVALGGGAAIFTRVDIVPGVTSYPKAPTRTDCAAVAACTYDEEMTNFANWYAYYRTRNQMMKTAVGQAFQPLTSNYNVGIVSLSNAADTGTQNLMTVPAQFTGSVRTNWYNTLYRMSTTGSTPMRVALNAVGQMYANQGKYQQAAGSEVVQYPCQQNFTLITTDGYWNGNAVSTVPDNDNSENLARFCSKASGCVDPRPENPSSLADVALYWYNGGSGTGVSSLRVGIDSLASQGLVPAQSGENTHLHMNTYALGLGVDGLMNYEPNYDTAPQTGGDFYRLVTGATSGCPWNNDGPYVWPDPATGNSQGGASVQARVDDLWHSAINGHGKYFSASDPAAVVSGLNTALSNIQVRLGAAAAAATSTPNISLEDNDIFSATFTTVRWYGEITDRKIDPTTGIVGNAISWSSSTTLGALVATDASGADGRTIYMLDTSTPRKFKNFLYAEMSDTEKAWFSSKCSALAQCASLSAGDRAIVDSGANIVNWLRGQQQYADGVRLRAYTMNTPTGNAAALPIVLGDVASAKPAYQREPRKAYADPDYATFRANNADRKPYVFVAANDGMLHAFDAGDGSEAWAYAPRITMKKLYLQAGTTYATNHQFTADGSPEIGDVKINGVWRSVLVAGLNGGGRGYYAVDVTDPENPAGLWEICADPDVCSGASLLPNLGLSFGNPQFGTWKDGAGTSHWVVFLSSGYNNVPGGDNVNSGDGHGYLYVVDVASGQVLATTGTGTAVGDTGTPSGLAKITAITANPSSDPQVTYVYGGDNLGNMWRFDFSKPGAAPAPVLMGAAGSTQPITSRPEVTMCAVTTTDAQQVSSVSAQKFVVFGTGRMLDLPDLSDTSKQAVYVLKDTGAGISASDWRAVGKMADRQLTKVTSAGTDSYTIGGATVNLGTQLGWFFDLDQNSGERVNLDPKVVAGTLNVVTNVPSSSSNCAVGGTSNVYQLNVCTAAPVAVNSGSAGSGAGYTLSNTSAAVGYIIVRLPSGALKMITTTADGSTITTGVTPASLSAPHRAGWRQVGE